MQLAVVQSPDNPAAKRLSCGCFRSLKALKQITAHDLLKGRGAKRNAEMFITNWAIRKASYATYLHLKNPKVPVVGLISVPGSGNTWTRLLVQKLTGVLSGSVYSDRTLFMEAGLVGESEPWHSRRTSFVKNHLRSINPTSG